MYLRFRTSFLDEYRDNRTGVFQAAYYLMHSEIMCPYEHQQLQDVWDWFRNNLRAPRVYQQSRDASHIICWFKPTARQQLQKMYEMIHLLELYGMHVSQVRSHKPGYVVYEDDNQVAVVPFREIMRNVR